MSGRQSPVSSSGESSGPHTPMLDGQGTNDANSGTAPSTGPSTSHSAAANDRRRAARRNTTAEKRASHNAVEKARRETLNGRFLDLAALLPNLSPIRRPSKSAIVNGSIAHVQAAQRHRAAAARELRLLKLETDALRRELNEWRVRKGISLVDEPPRSDTFSMVLAGEMEVLPEVQPDADEVPEEEYEQQQGRMSAADPRYIQQQQQIEHARRLAMLKAGMLNGNEGGMYGGQQTNGFDLTPLQQQQLAHEQRLRGFDMNSGFDRQFFGSNPSLMQRSRSGSASARTELPAGFDGFDVRGSFDGRSNGFEGGRPRSGSGMGGGMPGFERRGSYMSQGSNGMSSIHDGGLGGMATRQAPPEGSSLYSMM
ncbi:hypothetical protein BD626DRAFT_573646 [Schizophyllum amplum]|uniref:BHLH domain-containing protein n=1 Tax=Schizophyllum amplum TaxID=97359 RepID=A0A550C0W4_9AGAR|nr:hypothetical protein BD626DRAFT_573646 [Auriculariopsis ampla]